jgi:hypothetical protein
MLSKYVTTEVKVTGYFAVLLLDSIFPVYHYTTSKTPILTNWMHVHKSQNKLRVQAFPRPTVPPIPLHDRFGDDNPMTSASSQRGFTIDAGLFK